MRRRLSETLVLLIVCAVLLKMAIAFIEPLVPYILLAAVLGLGGFIGFGMYRKRRTW